MKTKDKTKIKTKIKNKQNSTGMEFFQKIDFSFFYEFQFFVVYHSNSTLSSNFIFISISVLISF